MLRQKWPYVQAIQAGNRLYASGQLGLDPETGEFSEGIEAQTKQALATSKMNIMIEEKK